MRKSETRKSGLVSLLAMAAALLWMTPARTASAQYSEPSKGAGATQQDAPAAQVPEAGPSKGVGETVIVPRRAAPKPAPAPEPKKVEKLPDADQPVFRSNVDLVDISVVVQNKDGN